HALGSRLSGRQAYFSVRGTRGLLRYMEAESPDVVHLRNLHANYVHLPMLLRYLGERDIPTVVNLHDCWYFTGKCCHYTMDGCNRWESGCGSCRRLSKDNLSWFIDATAEMWADKKRLFEAIPRLGVIGVSDWVTSEAERSFLSSAAIIKRIYNWIDLDVFKPAVQCEARHRLALPEGFVILGVASGWSESKGLADFNLLAERLSTASMDSGLGTTGGLVARTPPTIILVGGVGKRVSVSRSIHLAGITHDVRELAEYYSAADVFLQLSAEETFGKVTAEALACGTPAIVYDSTANPELIGPGCGYVVDRGDLSQVMSRIRDVASAGRPSFSDSCRRFAESQFEKDRLINEHVVLYEQLCALSRKG
ncbi:MAG: glycosyltransferase, partial [Actinomycetota bacterium]|nr:glycosyltransferase [Actinomycetota bacterium]